MSECMTTTATSTTQTRGSRGRPCCRRSTSSHAHVRLETGYRYRVSHITGPTFFLPFSRLLEHVQRNFS